MKKSNYAEEIQCENPFSWRMRSWRDVDDEADAGVIIPTLCWPPGG